MGILSMLTVLNAVCGIILQAIFPNKRHSILLVCSAIALLLVCQSRPLMGFLSGIPWDTILMLFSLTVFGEFVFGSNLFDWLIKLIAVLCKGKAERLIVFINVSVYLVSSILNNYQALLLMLPVMVNLVKMMGNINQRYLTILFSSVLVSSNLAGASTPIGDFPALYLLSQKAISFGSYFCNATPMAVLAETVLVLVSVFAYRRQPICSSPIEEKMFVLNIQELYRSVCINKKMLIPSTVVFAAMFAGWLLGYNPTIVSLLGVAAVSVIIKCCTYSEWKIKALDASIFVYFISLFIIIASIQQTEALPMIAEQLMLIKNKTLLIVVFSFIVVVVTGVVSAGPSTVVFFPICMAIQSYYPDNMAITCFCLSICAGSSLFLSSATAGPLLTRVTEMAGINVDNEKFLLSFKNYLVPGLIGSAVIFLSNLLYLIIRTYVL